MRALTAALPERNGNSGGWPALILLGIFGAALLYGDGIEAHIHDVEHRGARSTLVRPRARRPRVRDPLAEAAARAVRAPADA